jgi:DNA-binding beta-propeller fold protein YncE
MGVFTQGNSLSAPFGMAFGPDGNLYVASNGDNTIVVYDGTTGAFMRSFPVGEDIYYPQFMHFAPSADFTPNAFHFQARTNVPLGMSVISDEIVISGIDTPASITVVGGTYSINSEPFTPVQGSVNAGDRIIVRLTSSSAFNTTTCATLSIGGISGDFCTVTDSLSINQLIPILLDMLLDQ